MNNFYKFTIRVIITISIISITSQNNIAYANNNVSTSQIIYDSYNSLIKSIGKIKIMSNEAYLNIERKKFVSIAEEEYLLSQKTNTTDEDIKDNKELIDKIDNFEKTRIINTDIHKPSGLTSEEYDKLIEYTLKSNGNYNNSKLIGLGTHLYKTEQENKNINGLFILSIMSEESGWGRSNPALNNNNLGGIMKSYPDGQKIRTFSSCGDCVLFMGRLLSKNYIDEGLVDVVSVGKKYCPPSYDEWANSVEYILNIYNDNINYIVSDI